MEAFLFGTHRGISLLAFAEGMHGQPLTAWLSSTVRENLPSVEKLF